jgi:hypothetical protein
VVAELPKASPESGVRTVHAKGAECSPPYFDVSLPYINDPSQNPVVAILDHKTTRRRIPKKLKSLQLIPAQYFVARKNGLCEWVYQRTVKQPSDCSLILGFERKYPRSKQRVCEPMTSHPNSVRGDEVADTEEEAVSSERKVPLWSQNYASSIPPRGSISFSKE